MNEICYIENELPIRKIEIEGETMKQYIGDKLEYEGGWSMKENEYVRNGVGYVATSSSQFQKVVYNQGQEQQVMIEVKGDEMIEYDENHKIVYKGGYEKGCIRKGEGFVYSYENNSLKRISKCIDGQVSFVWKVLDGNKMKELNENGICLYYGEYKEEELIFYREGEGDEFDNNAMLIYSGRWKHDKREGSGCYYKNRFLVYEGEWKDGLANGKGKVYDTNGDIIRECEWKDGYSEIEDGVWVFLEDDKKRRIYQNGKLRYDGLMENDRPEGYGVFYDKKIYEGEWRKGVLEIDENVFIFYRDSLIRVKDENGIVKYRGEWKDGKPEGYGIYFEDGKKKYEGEWKNGYYHTKGSTWFNYVNEKEQMVIPLKKTKSVSNKKNIVFIEDVMNKEESEKEIKKWKCILFVGISIISILVLMLVIYLSYYIYICNRTDVTIHNSFEWNHMSKKVRNLVISEGVCNDLTGLFEFSHYQYLESLTVNAHSFQNVISLTITDNPQLSSISFKGISFDRARILIISSIF